MRFKLDNENLLVRCSFGLYLALNVSQQGQCRLSYRNVVLRSLLVWRGSKNSGLVCCVPKHLLIKQLRKNNPFPHDTDYHFKCLLGLSFGGEKKYLHCTYVSNAFLMASSGQGGIGIKLPQNLRNIWVVQVFSISDICFTKLLLRVLGKMVMSRLHLDGVRWGRDCLLTFSVCVQSLQ